MIDDRPEKLSAHEVAVWLRRHPSFLGQFPDLAASLVVPKEDGKTATLSSYQLETLPRVPTGEGMVMNVSRDDPDRCGWMEATPRTKARICRSIPCPPRARGVNGEIGDFNRDGATASG